MFNEMAFIILIHTGEASSVLKNLNNKLRRLITLSLTRMCFSVNFILLLLQMLLNGGKNKYFMNDSLENIMATKTDEELETYLIDIKKYSAEEVRTALAEQQKRGKQYNQLQLNYIQQIIQRKVIAEDTAIPVLYAKETIFIFSFLCSVFFGAILLSINIRDKRDKWVVIGFGITYTVFMATIGATLAVGMPLIPIVLSAIGGAVLQSYFWDKYIGKEVAYKKKSVLIPFLIAIVIFGGLFLLAVYGG